MDEKLIFENMTTLSYPQILGPLKNCQAFPKLYLLSIKLLSSIFSYSLLSLRAMPFLCMAASFFVWVKVYRDRFLGDWELFLVVLSFSCSYAMSYYAAELKHYSMDVLLVGIFTLYFTRLRKGGLLNIFLTGIVLLFLLFWSYAGIFIFAVLVLLLLRGQGIREAKVIVWVLCILLAVVVLWAFYYYDLRFALSQKCLFDYWRDYFLCTDSAYCFVKSFGEGLRKLVIWFFGTASALKMMGAVFIPFFLFSLISIGTGVFREFRGGQRKLHPADLAAFIIFLELFIFGILKKYPFTGERITLFFAPFVFLLVVGGISRLRRLKALYWSVGAFFMAFLVLCGIGTFLKYLKLYL